MGTLWGRDLFKQLSMNKKDYILKLLEMLKDIRPMA
jgi:hypothetical protein